MELRIHAVCLALNEEIFISEQLKALYPFCSGISVLSQYDRDWYGKPVHPDRTARIVLDFPDPEGKIHFVVRRWRDQAAALNSEIQALSARPDRGIESHGTPIEAVRQFHAVPDYFLIVDADEIYDVDSLRNIIDYLSMRRPRGMRVKGYTYKGSWNRRVPEKVVRFCQFGFVRPGLMFEHVRVITWNEHRVSKGLRMLGLPDISSRCFGFITCPEEVGVFHHGCWLGSKTRIIDKCMKSAHMWAHGREYIESIGSTITCYLPTEELPRNIREGRWPDGFVEHQSPKEFASTSRCSRECLKIGSTEKR